MRLNWERKTGLLALALALYWLGPAPCHGQGSTIVYGRLWNPNPQNPPPPWDEIGTPCGVTIDFQTLEDNTVTLRDRDTMQQIRVSIDELERIIEERVRF